MPQPHSYQLDSTPGCMPGYGSCQRMLGATTTLLPFTSPPTPPPPPWSLPEFPEACFGGGGIGTHEGVSLAARHPLGEVDSGQKLVNGGLRLSSSHYPVSLLCSGLWRKEHWPQSKPRKLGV